MNYAEIERIAYTSGSLELSDICLEALDLKSENDDLKEKITEAYQKGREDALNENQDEALTDALESLKTLKKHYAYARQLLDTLHGLLHDDKLRLAPDRKKVCRNLVLAMLPLPGVTP